jgi:uncharacterized iron-regulated protein
MALTEILPVLFLVALPGVQASTAQPAPTQAPEAAGVAPASVVPPPAYVPERVYESGRKRFSDFEAMLADLSRADVVFVGEQHDDPNTHLLELAVLEGLARRRGAIILALEMFERDAQPVLDQYLAGRISEQEFRQQSRPWPRYRTDYRPLVEFAKARGWTVVASNVPRKLANEVSKAGLGFLDGLDATTRGYVATDLKCPFDDYYRRFAETMNAHPMPGDDKKTDAQKRETTERFYFAQCVKDETMAESIAQAYRRAEASRPLVVHFNGAFHSDYGWGTASRTERRLPGARVKVVTMVPVANLDGINPSKDDRKLGEYLVYTLQPPSRTATGTGARAPQARP